MIMFGLLRRIIKGSENLQVPREEDIVQETNLSKVSLKDYFHELTRTELDALEGREVTIKNMCEDVHGKIKKSPSFGKGYAFITRRGDSILEQGPIFPAGEKHTSPFGEDYTASIYQCRKDVFFLDFECICTKYHVPGGFLNNYGELDACLRQGELDFKKSA